MKFKLPSLVLVVCLFNAVALESRACTSFGLCDGTNIVVGNNDDWWSVSAYLVVNQRGITKQAFISSTNGTFSWTSKYGSVGVDYNAIGIPSAGMNEVGLVVDELHPGVRKPQYEPADQRPVIDEIQWIQYQLDHCATVEEVLQTQEKIRIVPYYWHSHYFVYDRQGHAAAIGFADGKMTVQKIPAHGPQVLANRPYDLEIQKVKQLSPQQRVRNTNGALSSSARFCVAEEMTRAYREGSKPLPPVEYGFSVLTNVSQPFTSISWVYDPVNLAIHYRSRADGRTRTVRLKSFDFDGRKPMLLVDMNIPKSGDISGDFKPYTLAISRLLVTQTIKDWRAHNFAMHITDADVERLIQYPETLKRAE